MHQPGASSDCTLDQVAQFVAFKEDCWKLGKQEPKGEVIPMSWFEDKPFSL